MEFITCYVTGYVSILLFMLFLSISKQWIICVSVECRLFLALTGSYRATACMHDVMLYSQVLFNCKSTGVF